MEQNVNKKILLHACCAICSGYPITLLKELGYEEGALVFSACVNDWFDTYIFDEEGTLNDLRDAGRV